MPLKDKYLKYSPEITLEIFTLIWDKLISMGWTNNYKLIQAYKEFCERGTLRDDNNQRFFPYSQIIEEFTETTVQEILEYNPFKDDFILPEKWAIKHSKEVGIWFDRLYYPEGDNIYESTDYKYLHYPKVNSAIWNSIQKGYTEITFEQFQKYVLKTTEQPKVVEKDWSKASMEELLTEVKSKYTIGCKVISANKTTGKTRELISVPFVKGKEIWCYVAKNDDRISTVTITNGTCWAEIISLPETKVESKSIEKWSVGGYVVFCKYSDHNQEIGTIDKITEALQLDGCVSLENYGQLSIDREKRGQLQWFTTLQEAEIFAKTLVEPVKEVIKQPSKQAVHCETQEEWNFVCKKIDYKFSLDFSVDKCDAIYWEKQQCCNITWYKQNKFQILSFQEWCDLNGYKMEKEVKFEVGKWYKYNPDVYLKFERIVTEKFRCSERIVDGIYSIVNSLYNTQSIMPVSIEEIQQYLPDGHPDKIKVNQEFKVGDFIMALTPEKTLGCLLKKAVYKISRIYKDHCAVESTTAGSEIYFKDIRHATPEEINNYLISIGEYLNFITNLQMGVTVKDPFYSITGNPCKDVLTRGQCKLNLLSTESEIKIIIKSKNKIKI